MTWRRFWTLCEAAFDRFNTVAVTLMILKAGDYLQIGFAPIITLLIVALIGGIAAACAAAIAAELDSERMDIGATP